MMREVLGSGTTLLLLSLAFFIALYVGKQWDAEGRKIEARKLRRVW